MATIDEIQNFLNIEIGERRLRNGKKEPNKNKYYYYENQYYIVQLTKNRWVICEDCNKTRRLLRMYCWYFHEYAKTRVNQKIKSWHQLFLTYEVTLVADHINRFKYDNRSDNLRIVSPSMNSRNVTKRKNNMSGTKGVCLDKTRENRYYWKAEITNNDGVRLDKKFSINKLGNDEAKRLAIEQRRIWEEEYGYLGD